ncbi:hypothetical protein DFH09DRAFT_1111225, partial [Mycena vulgaris]
DATLLRNNSGIMLAKLQQLSLPSNPSDIQMRKSINFFSEVLGCFVLPFITVEMSLSQQVESLSTYAFLTAALEVRHGSYCLTGPLYSDSQAVVKNIIFTIARMQLIDPKLKLYIILDGTDHLEMVFGDTRSQDHAWNFDVEQLAGKLGVDNTCVGDVDLEGRWKAGEIAANALLEKHFSPSGRVDFRQLFSKPGFDLLQPTGKYVGLDQNRLDRRSEEENKTDLLPSDSITASDDDCDRPGLMSPEEIHSVQNTVSEKNYKDIPLRMDLDQFFPDEVIKESDKDKNPVPVAFLKTIEAEGKKYFKSSLVATLSSNQSKKTTMRTLRVRGAALEDLQGRKSEVFDPADLSKDDLLKSGDLVVTLLHTEGQICLGILMVKGIRIGTNKSI